MTDVKREQKEEGPTELPLTGEMKDTPSSYVDIVPFPSVGRRFVGRASYLRGASGTLRHPLHPCVIRLSRFDRLYFFWPAHIFSQPSPSPPPQKPAAERKKSRDKRSLVAAVAFEGGGEEKKGTFFFRPLVGCGHCAFDH